MHCRMLWAQRAVIYYLHFLPNIKYAPEKYYVQADNMKPKSKYIPWPYKLPSIPIGKQKINNIFIKWKLMMHLASNSKGTSLFLKLKI